MRDSAASASGNVGQRAQLREPVADEIVRQGLVAIKDRPRARALGHLVGDLRAGLEEHGEALGRRACERVELIVQAAVPHGRVVRRGRCRSCAGRTA